MRARSASASRSHRRPSTSTLPGGRREQPLEDLDGRRLPRAVGTEEPEALAASHLEIEPVDGDDVAVSLHQTFDANRGVHCEAAF